MLPRSTKFLVCNKLQRIHINIYIYIIRICEAIKIFLYWVSDKLYTSQLLFFSFKYPR